MNDTIVTKLLPIEVWLAAWSFIRAETMPREFGLLSRSVLLLLCTAASSLSLAPVRDSALPLSNKRILLPMIRAEAASSQESSY